MFIHRRVRERTSFRPILPVVVLLLIVVPKLPVGSLSVTFILESLKPDQEESFNLRVLLVDCNLGEIITPAIAQDDILFSDFLDEHGVTAVVVQLNVEARALLLGDLLEPLLREDHDDDQRRTGLVTEIEVLLHIVAVDDVEGSVVVTLADIAKTVDLALVLRLFCYVVRHEQNWRSSFLSETVHRLE